MTTENISVHDKLTMAHRANLCLNILTCLLPYKTKSYRRAVLSANRCVLLLNCLTDRLG